MIPVPCMPPSVATPLIPPVPVVKARLNEAMNDVRLLKQLLKLSEAAELTVGVDVLGSLKPSTITTPVAHDAR